MSRDKIYTCYGCVYYYKEEGDKYPTKHCEKDHLKCRDYWGEQNERT